MPNTTSGYNNIYVMSLWEGNLDRQGFFKTPGSMELVERNINGDPTVN